MALLEWADKLKKQKDQLGGLLNDKKVIIHDVNKNYLKNIYNTLDQTYKFISGGLQNLYNNMSDKKYGFGYLPVNRTYIEGVIEQLFNPYNAFPWLETNEQLIIGSIMNVQYPEGEKYNNNFLNELSDRVKRQLDDTEIARESWGSDVDRNNGCLALKSRLNVLKEDLENSTKKIDEQNKIYSNEYVNAEIKYVCYLCDKELRHIDEDLNALINGKKRAVDVGADLESLEDIKKYEIYSTEKNKRTLPEAEQTKLPNKFMAEFDPGRLPEQLRQIIDGYSEWELEKNGKVEYKNQKPEEIRNIENLYDRICAEYTSVHEKVYNRMRGDNNKRDFDVQGSIDKELDKIDRNYNEEYNNCIEAYKMMIDKMAEEEARTVIPPRIPLQDPPTESRTERTTTQMDSSVDTKSLTELHTDKALPDTNRYKSLQEQPKPLLLPPKPAEKPPRIQSRPQTKPQTKPPEMQPSIQSRPLLLPPKPVEKPPRIQSRPQTKPQTKPPEMQPSKESLPIKQRYINKFKNSCYKSGKFLSSSYKTLKRSCNAGIKKVCKKLK